MPRFCASLTYLFRELPLLRRIGAARRAGFEAVEILLPYDEPAAAIAEEARLARMPVALIAMPPPNWTGGPRGFAAVPGEEARFRIDFDRALRFAKVLKAQHLLVMAGRAGGVEARATFLTNLRWAADHAPKQSLVIEPVSRQEMPGHFLNDANDALEIIRAVDAPNLRLLFDAAHIQAIHGDALAMWPRCAALTVHVQVAGFPGRAEPDAGEIDYPAFFAALEESGYTGWTGAEYRPAGETCAGLGWMR